MAQNQQQPRKRNEKSTGIVFMVLFALTLLFSSVSIAQTKSNEWINFKSTQEVELFYKYAECNDPANGIHKENVNIKMVNLTNNKVEVKWNTAYWYNNNCIGCNENNEEFKHQIVLEANESIEGDCLKNNDQALVIFSKMLNVQIRSKLTKFEFKNLTSNSLK